MTPRLPAAFPTTQLRAGLRPLHSRARWHWHPVGAHARHVRPGDATAGKQRVRGTTPGVPSSALCAAVRILPSIGMRAGLKKSMFWCETKGFCSFCLFAKEALLEVS